MTTSIVVQSLGNVKKATAVSFIRQIILFIPISLILCIVCKKGVYGALYAGCIADSICFIISIFILYSEYKKLNVTGQDDEIETYNQVSNYNGPKVVVTISREYGSGGRYVGKILANKINLPFYDKELISLTAKESGFSKSYVSKNDEIMSSTKYENNNDDRMFIAESKVIKNLAKNSCVIVGRCSDFILKDSKNTLKVFLYSDNKSKVKRAVKYYGIKEEKALKEIEKINKQREKHYKYYTNREWKDPNNYDLMLNVDLLGVEKCADIIKNIIETK